MQLLHICHWHSNKIVLSKEHTGTLHYTTLLPCKCRISYYNKMRISNPASTVHVFLRTFLSVLKPSHFTKVSTLHLFNPLNPELNPICFLLALLGAHHFLHVSRIRVKLLTFRLLMLYIYMEYPFLMFLDHTQRRSTVGRTPLDE